MSSRNTPVRDDTSRVVRSRPGCGPPYDARALVVGRIRWLLTQKSEFLFFLFVWFSALHARWKRKNDCWTDSDHVFDGRQSLDLQLRILGWMNGRLKKYLIPEDTVNFLFQILNAVEPLLWDTCIQGTASFRGLKIWSRKNVHRRYLLPLWKGYFYSRERNTFSGSGNPGLTSIQGTP